MGGRTRKKVKKPSSAELGQTYRDAIVQSVAKMLDNNAEEIEAIRVNSEQGIISIGIGAKIDGSESEIVVTTQLRFVETHIDKVTTRMENPNQGKFEFIEDVGSDSNGESEEEKPKDKKKPKKGEEAEQESAAE